MLVFSTGLARAFSMPRPYGQLPSNMVLGADVDGAIASELCSALELPAGQLPVVVIADTFNRVVFVRQGYSVGLADALLQTLSRVGGLVHGA